MVTIAGNYFFKKKSKMHGGKQKALINSFSPLEKQNS
jgi:hypothetical protein